MSDSPEISYVVDARDRLVSVSPGWMDFASRNGGGELTPEKVKGRELWDFVHDEVTRRLYREVLARVRGGTKTSLVLRCDGPEERRLIELIITRQPGEHVEFKTVQLASKSRPAQRLLESSTPRTAERLMVCSWCDRVSTGPGRWMEVEEAMEQLHLDDQEELPGIEPATCPVCHAKVIHALEASACAR